MIDLHKYFAVLLFVNYRYGGIYIEHVYGAGTGPIWLSRVQCVGNESSIADCSHSGWGGVPACWHRDDVSVSCANSSELIGN